MNLLSVPSSISSGAQSLARGEEGYTVTQKIVEINGAAGLKKSFIETFGSLCRRRRSLDVWSDFITMAACSLSNAVDIGHYEERETRYTQLYEKYSEHEQQIVPELLAYIVMALEANPEQDFLGEIYTALGLHDKTRKQEFTPYGVGKLMALIAECDMQEQVERRGYLSIADPTCGSGATLIARVHAARRDLQRMGLNFQNHVWVVGQDIDETAALMCYIQLSLLGVAAYIKVGDTLEDPISSDDTLENYWFTPMYFSDVWVMRRTIQQIRAMTKRITSEKRVHRLDGDENKD